MSEVSIMIPVYNAERFLHRCIESVLSQTYKDIEVIAVNDGSTDGSITILRAYEAMDCRFHVVNQENMGVSTARNKGLSSITGDYILFVDADDWIEPDMVEILLKHLQKTPEADIAVCAGDHAETPEDVENVADIYVDVWKPDQQKREFLTHQRLQGMLWNKLIRSSLFNGLIFDPTVGYGEDAQIMWKVLARCRNMVLTNQILYHHVIEPTSISNRSFSPRKYSAVKVWEKILENVREEYPALVTLATERLCFYATFTLYEMFTAGHKDAPVEKKFIGILRRGFSKLMRAPSVSLKTKLFATLVMISPAVAKRVLLKRK